MSKQIPYYIIAFLIIVIFFKDCQSSDAVKIKTDTVTVTKIDTVYKEVKGQAVSTPKIVKVIDTVNYYITKVDSCNKLHLSKKGIDLLKYRQYKDTVNIKGYFVSYDLSVIGELKGIELFLNGNVPTIKQSTVRTVTNTVKKQHSIGSYLNYNRSLQVGVMYNSKSMGYGLNYDLENKSIGVQLSYTPFRW